MKRSGRIFLWVSFAISYLSFFSFYPSLTCANEEFESTAYFKPGFHEWGELFCKIEPFPQSRCTHIPLRVRRNMKRSGKTIFVDDRSYSTTNGVPPTGFLSSVSIEPVKAYTAYIQYHTTDSLFFRSLQQGDRLVIALEAKNSQGEWLPVLSYPHVRCLKKAFRRGIPVNKFFATKIPVLDGDFRTEMRIVGEFGTSNVFMGNMDLALFEKINSPDCMEFLTLNPPKYKQ